MDVVPKITLEESPTLGVRDTMLTGSPVSDMTREQIHRGNMFGAQNVYEQVPDEGKVGFRVVAPLNKKMEITLAVDAEGKTRLRSYAGATPNLDGTLIPAFNHLIEAGAPVATGAIYGNETATIEGPVRFNQVILGGTGPNTAGSVSGFRLPSILGAGLVAYVELENVSGQPKDIGVEFTWSEIE